MARSEAAKEQKSRQTRPHAKRRQGRDMGMPDHGPGKYRTRRGRKAPIGSV